MIDANFWQQWHRNFIINEMKLQARQLGFPFTNKSCLGITWSKRLNGWLLRPKQWGLGLSSIYIPWKLLPICSSLWLCSIFHYSYSTWMDRALTRSKGSSQLSSLTYLRSYPSETSESQGSPAATSTLPLRSRLWGGIAHTELWGTCSRLGCRSLITSPASRALQPTSARAALQKTGMITTGLTDTPHA